MNILRDEFIKSCNSINQELVKHLINKEGEYYHFARNMHTFIHERIDSLSVLIFHNCLWDADIILRSVAEASIKLIFVSELAENEKLEKVSEFWNDLGEINNLKQSKQARIVIENLKNTKFNPDTFNQIALSEEQEELLASKWTKSKRQKIEQPWSFNEMIKSLSKNDQLDMILCLQRVFTQSSHLIHADETALGVINDRKNRNDSLKLEILHAKRLYSDCLSLYALSTISILKSINKDNKDTIRNLTESFFKRCEIIENNHKL